MKYDRTVLETMKYDRTVLETVARHLPSCACVIIEGEPEIFQYVGSKMLAEAMWEEFGIVWC